MKAKHHELIAKTIILVGLWALFFTIIQFNVYWHEKGHQQINNYYGIKSEITIYDFGWSGKTIPVYGSCSDVNNLCREAAFAQAEYEGFAYTVLPIFFSALLILMLFLSFVILDV